MSSVKRTNYMRDLANFLDAWDNPDRADNRNPVNFFTTQFGNINSTGIVGDYRGHALTRRHPQFTDSVEPKVRALVRILIERFDWVTYSSCQGHLYKGHTESPVERNVGLVPRNHSESEMISTILGAVVDRINKQFREAPVYLELFVHTLEGQDVIRPALDLRFGRHTSASWEQYFEYVDGMTEAALEVLANVELPMH